VKRDVSCACENIFAVEAMEEINLDEQPLYPGEILDGTLMTFACSVCGKKRKLEFPVTVLWPGLNLVLEPVSVDALIKAEYFSIQNMVLSERIG
jgi:hypothetical protein